MADVDPRTNRQLKSAYTWQTKAPGDNTLPWPLAIAGIVYIRQSSGAPLGISLRNREHDVAAVRHSRDPNPLALAANLGYLSS